MTALQRAIT